MAHAANCSARDSSENEGATRTLLLEAASLLRRSWSLKTCLAAKVLVSLLLLRREQSRGGHEAAAVRPHFFKDHAGARADGNSRAEAVGGPAASSTVGRKAQALLHPNTDFSFSLLSCHAHLCMA